MKKYCFLNKGLLLAAISMVFTVGTTTAAYAQWQQDEIGWRWVLERDGSYKSHGWHRIDGKMYYFTSEGYCLINTTAPDGSILNENGARVVNGEVDTLPEWSNPAYTLGISDEIWYLMSHTRAENVAKFGEETNSVSRPFSGLPYSISYASQFTPNKRMDEKPYVISLFSDVADISHLFAYAPDVEHNDAFTAARKLREMGYDAKAKKIIIGGGYACQFKVDRFWITIAYGTASAGTEIQIRQDFQDEQSAQDYYGVWSGGLATESMNQ